ncbi:MAG: hypothetical protein OQK24_02205 [Magnetovibrio sp.]|nr:hypothetical protein [Magnetovibrio sp.]
MSFKSFSSGQTTPAKDKSSDKVKDTAVNDQLPIKTDKNSSDTETTTKS